MNDGPLLVYTEYLQYFGDIVHIFPGIVVCLGAKAGPCIYQKHSCAEEHWGLILKACQN